VDPRRPLVFLLRHPFVLLIRLHLLHPIKAHRHPIPRDVETTRREEIPPRWFFSGPYPAYFSAAKRLFAARERFGLFPFFPFTQASNALDEHHGRSGLIRGYERSFNIVDAARKVRWPFDYSNPKKLVALFARKTFWKHRYFLVVGCITACCIYLILPSTVL